MGGILNGPFITGINQSFFMGPLHRNGFSTIKESAKRIRRKKSTIHKGSDQAYKIYTQEIATLAPSNYIWSI